MSKITAPSPSTIEIWRRARLRAVMPIFAVCLVAATYLVLSGGWSSLVAIAIAIPFSFIGIKLLTFGVSKRTRARSPRDAQFAELGQLWCLTNTTGSLLKKSGINANQRKSVVGDLVITNESLTWVPYRHSKPSNQSLFSGTR